jgi:hypothetical protein
MSTGATVSITTLLSAVEASGVCFIRCFIWSGWGSLSTLISSIQSPKEIGARSHLLLRGDKSLASRVRQLLRTMWGGAEDRSSRRRTYAGLGVGVLLSLMFLLALVCQYSSPILKHKSLAYHGLKFLKVMCFQCVGKSIIQTIEETLLLLLLGVRIIWSVAGKLCEMSDILIHHHGSLLQILKFLLL